jgi:hypothetical protein
VLDDPFAVRVIAPEHRRELEAELNWQFVSVWQGGDCERRPYKEMPGRLVARAKSARR